MPSPLVRLAALRNAANHAPLVVRSGEEQEFVLDTPNKYVLPIPLRVLNANTKLEPNV